VGWGPIPSFGVVGSAWATLISRMDCALALGIVVLIHIRRLGVPRPIRATRIDPSRLRTLLGLGVPAGLQMSLEVGVFATATALVAMLDVVSLSAHQIVLQIATLTFVVALGIGASGGVLVGQAIGAGDPGRARRTGWTAIAAGPAFMGLGALVFLLLPGPIVATFSTDPPVIEVGGRLLAVAAAFQLFDGLQASSTGVLRGVGDTRTPMVSNLVAHWAIGLPLGSLLAFGFGLGVVGMWAGLSLGLAVVGATLLTTWMRRSRHLSS
jgi:multidrug resistance protein, MATE family